MGRKETRCTRSISWSERFQFVALMPHDWILFVLCLTYDSFLWAFKNFSPRYLAWRSQIGFRRAIFRAMKHVPAYAAFVAEHEGSGKDRVPETDKEHYIKAYRSVL